SASHPRSPHAGHRRRPAHGKRRFRHAVEVFREAPGLLRWTARVIAGASVFVIARIRIVREDASCFRIAAIVGTGVAIVAYNRRSTAGAIDARLTRGTYVVVVAKRAVWSARLRTSSRHRIAGFDQAAGIDRGADDSSAVDNLKRSDVAARALRP